MLRKKPRLTALIESVNAHTMNYGSNSDNTNPTESAPGNDTDRSRYFSSSTSTAPTTLASKLLQFEIELNKVLRNLNFKEPVRYVYNPVEYAFETHAMYVEKYCRGEKKLLLLGMNPGPWGMCQTGVPFGEVNLVRDWFKVQGPVPKPERECPGKEVVGFECHRSEESGKRLIGLFKKICETPENFFKHSFMHNYCPIALMGGSGANITPSGLKGQVRRDLEEHCNDTLYKIVELLKVKIIVAIGRYAEAQVKHILRQNCRDDIDVFYMPHPSPRVVHNENWPEKAEKMLIETDLLKYFKP